MKARILLWSITPDLAGYLFGFDTVVISGNRLRLLALGNVLAIVAPFVIRRYNRRWHALMQLCTGLGCAVAKRGADESGEPQQCE